MLKANSCLSQRSLPAALKSDGCSAARKSLPMHRFLPLNRKMKSRQSARQTARHAHCRGQPRQYHGRATAVPEIDAAHAAVAQAEAARTLSLEQLERYEKLFASGYVSREQLDEIRASHTTNTARVAEAKAQLRTAQQSLGRDKEIEAARTGVEAARACTGSKQLASGAACSPCACSSPRA